MRIYTVHRRADRLPVLLREGFTWGGFVFGPFWLLAHRAWIAAILSFCAFAAASLLPPLHLRWIAGLAVAWVIGLWGQDMRRWALARRGFVAETVVSGRNADGALVRLLDARPEYATGGLP